MFIHINCIIEQHDEISEKVFARLDLSRDILQAAEEVVAVQAVQLVRKAGLQKNRKMIILGDKTFLLRKSRFLFSFKHRAKGEVV